MLFSQAFLAQVVRGMHGTTPWDHSTLCPPQLPEELWWLYHANMLTRDTWEGKLAHLCGIRGNLRGPTELWVTEGRSHHWVLTDPQLASGGSGHTETSKEIKRAEQNSKYLWSFSTVIPTIKVFFFSLCSGKHHRVRWRIWEESVGSLCRVQQRNQWTR